MNINNFQREGWRGGHRNHMWLGLFQKDDEKLSNTSKIHIDLMSDSLMCEEGKKMESMAAWKLAKCRCSFDVNIMYINIQAIYLTSEVSQFNWETACMEICLDFSL